MTGEIYLRTPRAIGALIRSARQAKGFDQASLAEQAGVSRQWVSEVENGKPSAEVGLILRALAVLDVHLSYQPPPAAERQT
jgi:HTH-type transcriptional regulator/antitoxin HipB